MGHSAGLTRPRGQLVGPEVGVLTSGPGLSRKERGLEGSELRKYPKSYSVYYSSSLTLYRRLANLW